jgi:HTH-type transcriptional regulator/antitoxin MqsA
MSEQRCLYCGGHLQERRVTRVQQFQGRWVVIENLPALVCQQCGERFYTPEAHDWVLSLVKDGGKPARHERIDVYDATSVSG